MILSIYALHDRVAGYYGAPFFMGSNGEAVRAVTELARDLSTQVGRHPADFALYHLGEFDNVTGQFHIVAAPTHLVGCQSLLQVRQPTLPLEESVK